MGDHIISHEAVRTFRKRRQQKGESVQKFASALEELSKPCNFGKRTEEELARQFVSNLLSRKITDKLDEMGDIEYQTMVKFAAVLESGGLLNEKPKIESSLKVKGLHVTGKTFIGQHNSYFDYSDGVSQGNLMDKMPKPDNSCPEQTVEFEDSTFGENTHVGGERIYYDMRKKNDNRDK